ncbi:MAG: hypothetical protein U0Q55_06870 [Vicinamibacterales bacterium]
MDTEPPPEGSVSIVPPWREGLMRPMLVYLSAYFTLIVVAGAVLWRAGVTSQIPSAWLFLAGFIAVALGVVLAVLSLTPTQPPTRE